MCREVWGGDSNAARGPSTHSEAGKVGLLHLLSFLLLQLNPLRYQGSLVALERQATDLMGEIKATHTRWDLDLAPTQANSCCCRVIQSLEEAEQARNDFLQLKEKAEFILSQLQVLHIICEHCT